MKRELFQNITVIPYISGNPIDRTGFLSAVLGFNAASGASVTVKVEHSDDGTSFEGVTDELVFPDIKTEGGTYSFKAPTVTAVVAAAEGDSETTTTPASAGSVVNLDVDLVGLKPFVKFTLTGATDPVVVLGDSTSQPV